MAYDARLPSGLEPPAVLHPEVEGGGVESARRKASRRKSTQKTPSASRNRDWIGNYCGSESTRISAIA